MGQQAPLVSSMSAKCAVHTGPERDGAHCVCRLFHVWVRTQGPHDPLLPGGP
ncbi:unnamed protein product, partial [Staurois parvus]